MLAFYVDRYGINLTVNRVDVVYISFICTINYSIIIIVIVYINIFNQYVTNGHIVVYGIDYHIKHIKY